MPAPPHARAGAITAAVAFAAPSAGGAPSGQESRVEPNTPTLAEVVRGVRAGERALGGLKATEHQYFVARWETTPSSDARHHRSAEVWFDENGRLGADQIIYAEDGNTFETTWAFDGEQLTSRATVNAGASGRIAALRRRFQPQLADGVMLADLLERASHPDAQVLLSTMLQNTPGARVLGTSRRDPGDKVEPLGEAPLVVVALPGIQPPDMQRPSGWRWDIELALDPGRNWLPAWRNVYARPADEPEVFSGGTAHRVTRTRVLGYERVGPVWVPAVALSSAAERAPVRMSNGMSYAEVMRLPAEEQFRLADAGVDISEWELIERTDAYTLALIDAESIRTGMSFEEADFRVEPRPGDFVLDEIEGVSFVQGEAGERIDEKRQDNALDELARLVAADASRPAGSRSGAGGLVGGGSNPAAEAAADPKGPSLVRPDGSRVGGADRQSGQSGGLVKPGLIAVGGLLVAVAVWLVVRIAKG